MALRTFRSNPSLGGFGSGDADGDAFCQIVKELVDNAVDACSTTTTTTKTTTGTRGRAAHDGSQGGNHQKKRVRVVIEPFIGTQREDLCDEEENQEPELLRVTVTDNGLGMSDIQKCVDPFSTTKAHQASSSSSGTTVATEPATAGRYGIGLTLCLLHAQRLVPDSSAMIRSATSEHPKWTQVTCVVDADRVQCIRREESPKVQPEESGTSISVLVPGGQTATSVWPRLAEYFARFRLSLGLECSLEVLAPTLSTVPLVVRPALSEPINPRNNMKKKQQQQQSLDDARQAICKAVELYLERKVELQNVAHAVVPIRFAASNTNNGPGTRHHADADRPMLEVDLVVHSGVGFDDDDNDEGTSDGDSNIESLMSGENDCGILVLIRMVNRIPLLDTSEAIACGLVQGVANKKRVWNSFGLSVARLANDTDNGLLMSAMKLPVFSIRDSDQVAPFFQRGAHALFQKDFGERMSDAEEEEDEDIDDGSAYDWAEDASISERRKRKRRQNRKTSPHHPQLLPAKVRLAHCICIMQIHAKPSALPLPTLSKGRLPLDNEAIDQALEVGLNNCLRQLQISNPSLVLTSSQLRVMERDYRYIPAVAGALARMVSNCSQPSRQEELVETISQWKTTPPPEVSLRSSIQDLARDDDDDDESSSKSHRSTAPDLSIETLQALIESRLGLVVAQAGTKKKKEKKANASSPSRRKHRGEKRMGRDDESASEGETEDPNDLLDRCTEWTEAFVDLQESDASTSGYNAGDKSNNAGNAAIGDELEDYDDWL